MRSVLKACAPVIALLAAAPLHPAQAWYASGWGWNGWDGGHGAWGLNFTMPLYGGNSPPVYVPPPVYAAPPISCPPVWVQVPGYYRGYWRRGVLSHYGTCG
jgi:hypothetical protein